MTYVPAEIVEDPYGVRLMPGVPLRMPAGAVVVDVTECDGDVDDEGRAIGINPRVVVRWPDGVEDDFTSSAVMTWSSYMREPLHFTCDDVIAEGAV